MSKYTGWRATLNTVLKQHNGYTADGGKVASYATQTHRKTVLLQGFRTLRKMGFKLKTVWAFRGKHVTQLVRHWEDAGLAAATIQNRLSVFRTFAGWIGKHGLVLPAERYVNDKKAVRRSYVATTDKTWANQGVDTDKKIQAVRKTSERCADALLLQQAFGLRSKESLLLRPHVADKGTVLIITHGTKGGRSRYVPIETPEQRQLLERLKKTLKPGESLVPRQYTYAQYRNRYYYVLRKHGIHRKAGVTPHGLRHAHLHALYQDATGQAPPVAGGRLALTDPTLDNLGRQLVAQRAGHHRLSIAAAYIGGTGGCSSASDREGNTTETAE